MSNWIFVIKDDENVFKKRIKHKKWPIHLGTNFQKSLKIEDKIVFYQAGKDGQKFLGTATVRSEVKPNRDKIDYYIDIDNINVWKKQPSIRDIISKLSFILNKNHWGVYFQGGVVKMDEESYSVILMEAEKLKSKK